MHTDSRLTIEQAGFDPKAYLLLSARIEARKMPSDKPTKHELKTRETRELLLRAAEQIIVRDGYENAELGEIAKLAGRTKGAIYAQFKSKEDVFLALVQDHALRRRAIMQKMLAASTSIDGNLAAFRKYFLEFAADDIWGFLLMEFKLYTVRHPGSMARLHKVYEGILPANEDAAYSALLGPPAKGKASISRALAVHSAFAMLTALQLESKFDPNLLSREVVKKVAAKIFDAMFGVEAARK
jgi:AcrR family transcriptional regulator